MSLFHSAALELAHKENFKLKQELAAVKARQAKNSAQLHALMARIGLPPESTECHSQNNPNRQATPKIPSSLPTPTDSAVTREEIREMLSALSQQLSQQFSIVFTQHLTQFGARFNSLETRLDTQIAETGGNIRRKRATRSSRTTEDQVPLRKDPGYSLRVVVAGQQIPEKTTIRILGMWIQSNRHVNHTLTILRTTTLQVARMISRVATRRHGMREEDTLKLIRNLVLPAALPPAGGVPPSMENSPRSETQSSLPIDTAWGAVVWPPVGAGPPAPPPIGLRDRAVRCAFLRAKQS
ncbi:hypothetical protein HPB49_004923 [Dermacentor silvarum]|uniref:Uncharacterized protein n=1 Tax=Dermacentor silvarum TaxID=543639 RepID=A0ACB8DAH1_DERSI|nr:hypothetical protein HPB49_004923 [Dermacentor silvarum]